MKVNRVKVIARVGEDAGKTGAPDPSIIIADGRDVPHHSSSDINPDFSPPPIMVGWIGSEDGQNEVLSSLSRDGGQSWSEPRALAAASDESFDSVTLFAEGRLSFAFLSRSTDSSLHVTAFKTADLGETWEPFEIDVQAPAQLVPGGRLLSYCGHYLLPVHSNIFGPDSVPFQTALLSDDLVAWHCAETVPDERSVGLADGQVTHTQPGEHQDGLIMVSRVVASSTGNAGEADGHASFALSTDCGATWGPSEPYLEVPSPGTPVFFTTDSLGRYVAVFNTPRDPHALKIRVKEPRGPWGPVRAFPSPGARNGSVDAVECAAGRYYCTFVVDDGSIAFTDIEP